MAESAPPAAPPAGVGSAASPSTEFQQAAAGLIETGMRFLESLAAVAQSGSAGQALSSLVSVEPGTNRPVLSIPLPQAVDRNRLVGALSALLGAFGRSA